MNIEKIYSINGPVVKIKGKTAFKMLERVEVGPQHLVGEVIAVNEKNTTIQVYESTTGLRVGDEVIGMGEQISVLLGPGIMSNIFDGIQRPLTAIQDKYGAFIQNGANVDLLDMDKLWDVKVLAKVGQEVAMGEIIATTQESSLIEHRVMVPYKVFGKVVEAKEDGAYTLKDWILKVDIGEGIVEVKLAHYWPIKTPRPISERLPISKPLVTGQRVLDAIFPIAKGGSACIPGGFGTGKTMTQHQIAKWCDAEVIVYIGCGERGNEMTQVLTEFKDLIDPKTNRPLLDRTILIANTSNMPVAAREASIYTGVTIAEYYRDMGYHVAVMADSTSRWAEALREISGRLEEMPAEEGFPAYLPSRLAQFYQRAGSTKNLNGHDGSITIIGAVSPQGSDFSEPVTQNTKRFVRVFWALDKALAYQRHYFAINWMLSYSEYISDIKAWYEDNVDYRFMEYRQKFIEILFEENKLEEVVKLIGADVLPEDQKLTMEIAKVIRVGFLQQNAFHEDDTYVPLEKQFLMMASIINVYERTKELVALGIPVSSIASLQVFDRLIKMKYSIPNNKLELFGEMDKEINQILATLKKQGGQRGWN